ncbi:BadF/BadG/BcrA/BcrD ATPase family protein, partial [Clostridium perfringens]
YWIALRTINEYTKQKDGRKERTALYDILEKEYNITYQYEIVDVVFNRLKFNRTELAKFSKICFLAAEEGCPDCKKIFRDVAEAIFEHINAISKELNFKDEFVVSYTGGVFKAGKHVLEPLQEMINNSKLKCKLQEPALDPWNGSVLLAYTLAGNKVPDNVK